MNLRKEVNEITKEKGKEFTLSLVAAMGYAWETEYDKNMLTLKKKEESQPTEKIGAGRKQRFTFVPIKAGETELVMINKRKWKESAPSFNAEERRYHITILE